jgi:uncharacterized protein (TIGR00730 family)
VPNSDAEAPANMVKQAARKTDDFRPPQSGRPTALQEHFTESDTWRILRIQSEFVHAFEMMSRVGPAVAVFGSARLPETSPYYQAAREVSAKLAKGGWAVITGGGPGIMEAGNKGAQEGQAEGDKLSVGLNIELPFEQGFEFFRRRGNELPLLFLSQNQLREIRVGVRHFPGGFGTLDEFFEALTLVQTHKIQNFPVIVFGSEYWRGLIDWMKTTLVDNGTILPSDLDLIHLTDDPAEVVSYIWENTRGVRPSRRTPRLKKLKFLFETQRNKETEVHRGFLRDS